MGYAQTAAVGIVLLTGSPVYTGLSDFLVHSSFITRVGLFSCVFSWLFEFKGVWWIFAWLNVQFLNELLSRHEKHTTFLRDLIPKVQQKRQIWCASALKHARLEQISTPSGRPLQNRAFCRPRHLKPWKRLSLAGFGRGLMSVRRHGRCTSGNQVKQGFGSKSMVFLRFWRLSRNWTSVGPLK